jgi:hypothetical protein
MKTAHCGQLGFEPVNVLLLTGKPLLCVGQVGLQGRLAGPRAILSGRVGLGGGCVDLTEQVAVAVEEAAVDGRGLGDAENRDAGVVCDRVGEGFGDALSTSV